MNATKKFTRIIALNKPLQRNDFYQNFETKNKITQEKSLHKIVHKHQISYNSMPKSALTSSVVTNSFKKTNENTNLNILVKSVDQSTQVNFGESCQLNTNTVHLDSVFRNLIENLFKFLKDKIDNTLYVSY